MVIQSKHKFKADDSNCIGRVLHFYSSKYDKFIVLGGFKTKFLNTFWKKLKYI